MMCASCATPRPFAVTPQSGDVLAVDCGGPMSLLIKWRTISKFDHIAVFATPTTVIDALPGGVAERPVKRYLAMPYVLLRPIGVTEVQRHGVTEFLEAQIGKRYDYLGCLGIAIGKNMDARRRYFCSELAVDAFAACGAPLIARKTSGMVSPELVYQSLRLQVIDQSDESLLRLRR